MTFRAIDRAGGGFNFSSRTWIRVKTQAVQPGMKQKCVGLIQIGLMLASLLLLTPPLKSAHAETVSSGSQALQTESRTRKNRRNVVSLIRANPICPEKEFENRDAMLAHLKQEYSKLLKTSSKCNISVKGIGEKGSGVYYQDVFVQCFSSPRLDYDDPARYGEKACRSKLQSAQVIHHSDNVELMKAVSESFSGFQPSEVIVSGLSGCRRAGVFPESYHCEIKFSTPAPSAE